VCIGFIRLAERTKRREVADSGLSMDSIQLLPARAEFMQSRSNYKSIQGISGRKRSAENRTPKEIAAPEISRPEPTSRCPLSAVVSAPCGR
jgi:hypothetical protein